MSRRTATQKATLTDALYRVDLCRRDLEKTQQTLVVRIHMAVREEFRTTDEEILGVHGVEQNADARKALMLLFKEHHPLQTDMPWICRYLGCRESMAEKCLCEARAQIGWDKRSAFSKTFMRVCGKLEIDAKALL